MTLRLAATALALLCAPSSRQAPPAVREDGPCASDADCAITRVPPGGCCALLCEGRAVTTRRAAELDAALESCRPACAEPQCAPMASQVVAVCRKARCTVERQSMQ